VVAEEVQVLSREVVVQYDRYHSPLERLELEHGSPLGSEQQHDQSGEAERWESGDLLAWASVSQEWNQSLTTMKAKVEGDLRWPFEKARPDEEVCHLGWVARRQLSFRPADAIH
jgi:hypothetical protein